MSWARKTFPSPLGPITARWDGRALKTLGWDAPWSDEPEATDDPHGVGAALGAYFSGDWAALDRLPVSPEGPRFQRQVWEALRAIPAGETLTYGELALRLGLPGSAARAVGGACGANPIGIVLPCHRVVGARGELTGYAGGLERKRWLLQHERARVARQLDLFARAPVPG